MQDNIITVADQTMHEEMAEQTWTVGPRLEELSPKNEKEDASQKDQECEKECKRHRLSQFRSLAHRTAVMFSTLDQVSCVMALVRHTNYGTFSLSSLSQGGLPREARKVTANTNSSNQLTVVTHQ